MSYVPLKWSAALAAEALVFAQKLADEGLFYNDSNRGPYGENLAMNSGSGVPLTADNVLPREFVCCAVPEANHEVYFCSLKY